MAIRFAPQYVAGSDALAAAIVGGWWMLTDKVGTASTQAQIAGPQRYQPSALSRPGNLGTAYTGVWTENVTTPNDNHRPIPFKDLVLAAGIILGPDLPFIQALNHRSPI